MDRGFGAVQMTARFSGCARLRFGPRCGGPTPQRGKLPARTHGAKRWSGSLFARTRRICSRFDGKRATGQMLPSYGSAPIVADLLRLRATRFRLTETGGPGSASFSPALREPHHGFVAGRESLASLDSAAPNQRLAFLLRRQGDRAALFARGIGWLRDLARRRVRSGQRGPAADDGE